MSLEQISALSVKYGSDPRFVLAGGGNTSFKDENGKNYSQGIEIIADAESELCGWTFATPQLMNDFLLEFEGLSAKTTFESLVITLTDSQNPNEEISIEFH